MLGGGRASVPSPLAEVRETLLRLTAELGEISPAIRWSLEAVLAMLEPIERLLAQYG